MADRFNKVSLVLDKNYGARLQSLVVSGPVWVIDTAANRMAAVDYWELNPTPEAAVTTFKSADDDSATAACLKILNTVDLHHGKYSGGYSVLEVIGVSLREELRSAVTELGFTGFESTPEGFRATR